MNRRLVTHYRGVCKNIYTEPKKNIDLNNEIENNDLQILQKLEMENTKLHPGCNIYTVIQKPIVHITVDDLKKGLENKTDFFMDFDKTKENEKKVIIDIKIKKRIIIE